MITTTTSNQSAEFPRGRDLTFQPVLSALKACPFFTSWPHNTLTSIAAVSSLRSFGAGEVIAAEGQTPNSAVVVVRGRVRAVRRAERGREVTLEMYRLGDLCFEAVFSPDATLSNDWIAAETTLLAFVSREHLIEHLRGNPDAALAAATALERRLRDAKTMAAGLVLDDVEHRLHDALLRLARSEGEVGPEGTVVRRVPTQQELANMIGACRETVSRIVAELARKGVLSLRGRRLTLTPQFFAAPIPAHAA